MPSPCHRSLIRPLKNWSGRTCPWRSCAVLNHLPVLHVPEHSSKTGQFHGTFHDLLRHRGEWHIVFLCCTRHRRHSETSNNWNEQNRLALASMHNDVGHTLLKTSLLTGSVFHRFCRSLWFSASSFLLHSSSLHLNSAASVLAWADSWSQDSELCSAKLPNFCWASARFHVHSTECFTNSLSFWQANSIPWLYVCEENQTCYLWRENCWFTVSIEADRPKSQS